MNPRVTGVNVLKDSHLLLFFNNGEKKVFNMNPYLEKGIFTQLKNPEIFNSVKVVEGTVQWNNDIDLCPDTLYIEGKPV